MSTDHSILSATFEVDSIVKIHLKSDASQLRHCGISTYLKEYRTELRGVWHYAK